MTYQDLRSKIYLRRSPPLHLLLDPLHSATAAVRVALLECIESVEHGRAHISFFNSRCSILLPLGSVKN